MKVSIPVLVSASILCNGSLAAAAGVVLNEKIMDLAKISAELSALAYEVDPPGDGYEAFGYYDREPDQALTAKKMGYCFGVFRGTTMTWDDWQQNFEPGNHDICVDPDGDGQATCCTTRLGFFEAYNTEYRDNFEQALRECAKNCTDPNECVVLTGHSQGGAIAAVSALYLADLNPYVITFGQPATLDAPCDLVTSRRWYRFINTKASHTVGICYDPVPFLPGLGADDFGHMMLLSEDNSGVAYIGLDAQDYFGPLNVNGFQAHSMIAPAGSEFPGYLDRLEALMANGSYPIHTWGYSAGSLCSQDKECQSGSCAYETTFSWNRCVGTQCSQDSDCGTGRCDSGVCLQKLGSCMACDEDSDCSGGKCLLFKCSNSEGLMDDSCTCRWNADCDSGRCEGIPPVCEARLAGGAFCDEDSDCVSNQCTWGFHCTTVTQAASRSITDFAALTNATEAPAPIPSTTKGLSAGGIVGIVVAVLAVLVAAVFGGKWYRSRSGYTEVPSVEE